MNTEILASACEKLGWKYEVKIEQNEKVLYVYNVDKKIESV